MTNPTSSINAAKAAEALAIKDINAAKKLGNSVAKALTKPNLPNIPALPKISAIPKLPTIPNLTA